MSTSYMNLTLPTVGPSGTQGPLWATEVNAAIDLIDGHDHSTNKGKRITPSGININQTLEMNSNQLSEIASLALDDLSAQPSSSSLIYEYGGELYFNDGSGNKVKLTSGGTINVASLGTITGDYSTSGADVKYVAAASSYIFSTPLLTYAEIDCGPLKIFGVGGYYAQLQQSVAQAGNLDWTLPALYPAATLPMKVSSAGVLSTDQIQTSEIADASVVAAKLATDSIETAKIVNAAVTADKLAAAIAGNGLSGGAGTALAVNVDNSTIEIASDTLRIKDLGIADAKISASAYLSRYKFNASQNVSTSGVLNGAVGVPNNNWGTISSGTFTAASSNPFMVLCQFEENNYTNPSKITAATVSAFRFVLAGTTRYTAAIFSTTMPFSHFTRIITVSGLTIGTSYSWSIDAYGEAGSSASLTFTSCVFRLRLL